MEHELIGTLRLPSHATEADILDALERLPRGGTIVLPEDRTINISSGLEIDVADRNITLDLNGSTLRKTGNVSVITGRGEQHDADSVRLGADGAGHTTVAYSHRPGDLKPGDWIKVISDDQLPGDRMEGNQPSRMGQAMEVLSVKGNVVTLAGQLINQSNYDTNVRASAYDSGSLVIRDGEIVGDQSHPSWQKPLVQLRSLIDPQAENLTLRDGVGRGINVVDSVNARLTDITAKNMLDGGPATLGIAVSSLSSTGTTVRGLYAEKITHAADNHAIGTRANSRYIEHYGGDIGMKVSDSVAIGARNFAWSWHSESVNGTFENVMAFDSVGFLMGRGIGGELSNSGGAGNQRGIMFYEYGDRDSRNITVDGVTLKETREYSVFAAQSPANNTITNSFLESYGPSYLASPKAVAVRTTTLEKAGPNLNDVLSGGGGRDMLLGGKGNDTISGGGNNDFLWGGAGIDKLTGGAGRDAFAFHSLAEASDVITDFQDDRGGDILDLSAFAAKYGWDTDGSPIANGYLRFVQAGADVKVQADANGGGNSFTTLATLKNAQASQLSDANLRLTLSEVAAPGRTTVPGTSAHKPDIADAPQDGSNLGSGSGHANGSAGADKLYASLAVALLDGGNGNDEIYGNRGNDLLKGSAGEDHVWGGGGQDRLYGGAGNDMLLGGAGSDSLEGGNGGDVLDGGPGGDVLAGGLGSDTASYARAPGAVTADIANARTNAGGAAGDRFSSVENLAGSAFGDVLRGDGGRNILDGGAGNDRLCGGQGADIMRGGAGADWLDGGAWADALAGGDGGDSFYFASFAQGGDRIADFQTGKDHLVISRAGFGVGPRESVDFAEGHGAHSADATVLYDRDSGRVMWDADGSGAQDAVTLAQLSPHTALHHGDILIA